MTRWYTIHATQGVTLARNVGYLSIGHGYYLEDGSETGNKLYANLGVLARAGVQNPQNPRNVPGIFAAAHHQFQRRRGSVSHRLRSSHRVLDHEWL